MSAPLVASPLAPNYQFAKDFYNSLPEFKDNAISDKKYVESHGTYKMHKLIQDGGL